MKKIMIWVIGLAFSLQSLACDWKNITENNGKFVYPPECHLEVGRLVKESEKRKLQVEELNKSLELKDLAIQKSDERAMKWKEEAYNQNKDLNTQYNLSKKNELLHLGLGIILTGIAVWGAGHLRK